MEGTVKGVHLKVKVYNKAGNLVNKVINPQKLGKLDLTLTELRSVFSAAKTYCNRDTLIEAILLKSANDETINREVVKNSLAYKESVWYFEELKRSSQFLIGKGEAMPVIRNRTKFHGQGNNMRTLEQRVNLCA